MNRRRFACHLTAILLACTLSSLAATDADVKIRELAAEFPGELGVFAKHLGTGETIAWRADERFPTASVIKVAVMAEAFAQIERGTLHPDAVVRVRGEAKVGGSGVLRELHDGAEVTIRDLIRLMIVVSDNTATNLLLERVGVGSVNAGMGALELRRTRIFRPTFGKTALVEPDLEREFGLGMSTPREIAALMELLARGRLVSAAASQEMLEILERQQDRDMIARHLPYDRMDIKVANKTGTDAEKQQDRSGLRGHVRADVAIVRARGTTFVIAVFARRVRDTSWTADNAALLAGARAARLAFDHFVAHEPAARR